MWDNNLKWDEVAGCLPLSAQEPTFDKVAPRTERVKYIWWPRTHNIRDQMKQKELNKVFKMISN